MHLVTEIRSTHDEFVPVDLARKMQALGGEPKRMRVIEAANHRFSGNRAELDMRITETLEWIQSTAVESSGE